MTQTTIPSVGERQVRPCKDCFYSIYTNRPCINGIIQANRVCDFIHHNNIFNIDSEERLKINANVRNPCKTHFTAEELILLIDQHNQKEVGE